LAEMARGGNLRRSRKERKRNMSREPPEVQVVTIETRKTC